MDQLYHENCGEIQKTRILTLKLEMAVGSFERWESAMGSDGLGRGLTHKPAHDSQGPLAPASPAWTCAEAGI